MTWCVTSCGSCAGDLWHARADGGVLARCVCGTHREHHRRGVRRGRGHDRPRAGEFFSGCALKAGESIHRDDLYALAPRGRLGGQPGFEDLLGAARDHIQQPGGTAAIMDGRQVQDDGDVFVPIRGMSPHVFIHANDTMAFTPSWIINQQARPFGQDSGIGGASWTHQGPGRRASPPYDERPHPSAPSAPLHARAWHADRPLDTCLVDATREHTPGTGSGARSPARSWDATCRAHAQSD